MYSSHIHTSKPEPASTSGGGAVVVVGGEACVTTRSGLLMIQEKNKCEIKKRKLKSRGDA